MHKKLDLVTIATNPMVSGHINKTKQMIEHLTNCGDVFVQNETKQLTHIQIRALTCLTFYCPGTRLPGNLTI